MNSISKSLLGLRLIGLANGMRSNRYALRRDLLDRRYLPAKTDTSPRALGGVRSAEAIPSGARFQLADEVLTIELLAGNLVRFQWGAAPTVSYGVEKTEWSEVAGELEETAEGWCLRGAELEILVDRKAGVKVLDSSGRLLRQEAAPERKGDGWRHRARLDPEGRVYGLGERAAPLNLRPGSYRLWNSDAGGTYGPGDDPLYINFPVYLCGQPEGSYLVFYDNSFDGRVRFDHTGAEAVFEGGSMTYYLVTGSPSEILERFTELTGRAPLPPRWALGYHRTRWLPPKWALGHLPSWFLGYHRERPGYDFLADMRSVYEGFKRHKLPLSVLHLDDWYVENGRIFSVDQQTFGASLPQFIKEVRQDGIHCVTILQEGIKIDADFDLYADGKRKDVFLKGPDGREIAAPLWAGWVAHPDFTDPEARDWWKGHYRRLLDAGFDGIWHDMNEPAAFSAWGELTLPLSAQHSFEGHGGDHREAHNITGMLMNRAGYEALREHRPERRPWFLSRSGWVGMQRYSWCWTGDVESSWGILRQTIPTVLGLGLAGMPYSGPDVGGFSGHPSTELYLRWFQMATFLPFFRTHSAFHLPSRDPWDFGDEALEIIREHLYLRYRLMPYLYTLAWDTQQTGHPLVRPLFWPEEEDPALWDVDDAFLLGDALLVAAVVDEGVRRRSVRLPSGSWYEIDGEAVHPGGGDVRLDAPLDRIPLLVKAGSILPMEEDGALVLHVYRPVEGAGQGILYLDEGDGYGPWRLDRFTLEPVDGGYELTRKSEGEYPWPYERTSLALHGFGRPGTRMSVEDLDGVRIEYPAL